MTYFHFYSRTSLDPSCWTSPITSSTWYTDELLPRLLPFRLTKFQTLPAKASCSSTKPTSRSTTSSLSTTNYISLMSTWSSRMVRLSTRIASGLSLAHGTRDTATQRASPTSGMSPSPTTALSLLSRSFSATAYMAICPTWVTPLILTRLKPSSVLR